jgi:hypothetical protein
MSRTQRLTTLTVVAASVLVLSLATFAQAPGQINADLSHAHKKYMALAPRGHHGTGSVKNGAAQAFNTISGIDSLMNFTGDFHKAGFDPNGNPQSFWIWDMVGNPPERGGVTTIEAPIVPVEVDLLDENGEVRVVDHHPLISDPSIYIKRVLNSPVFRKTNYSSSDVPTQISDAVQRAEFFNRMKQDWHTLLKPEVKAKRVMRVPAGQYFYAPNPDGSCCAFILVDINTFVNLLFPAVPTDTTTPIGAAENAGDITTKDLSTFLFPNTYLFFNGDPNQCCVLGFHSYDFEPGDASNGNRERRYVVNYSSWISEGLFGGGFQDITALSHEVAETYDDPFVGTGGYGITPWWQAPNGNCQDDLETGDVIEGLPNGVFPVKLGGFLYHPQNEALLQWFEFQSPSSALGGAYSYPDMTTLTALSAPQKAGCQ